MKIPYPVVRILGLVAEKAAACIRVPMAIAFCDEEGGLQYFLRMERTLPASTEIAMNKAHTAAVLRMSTADLGRLSQPGQMLYGIQNTHGGRIVLFGGGIPLVRNGCVQGSVGISGGTVDEDVAVAQDVVKAFEKMNAVAEQIGPIGNSAGGICPTTLEARIKDALKGLAAPLPEEFSDLLLGALLLATRGP